MPLKSAHPPYETAKIQVLDWNGVNIRKESQGRTKDQTSIQARVIRELKNRDYSIIFDDDDSGEAADVVAISLIGEPSAPSSIDIEFYHCKYFSEDTPGQRVEVFTRCAAKPRKASGGFLLLRRGATFSLIFYGAKQNGKMTEAQAASRLAIGNCFKPLAK